MAGVLVNVPSYGRKAVSVYVMNKDNSQDVEWGSIAEARVIFKNLTNSKKRPLSLCDSGRSGSNWTSFLNEHSRYADYYPTAKSEIIQDDELSQFLLKAEEDLNVFDNAGRSALSLACIAGYYEVTQLYIELGADVNAKCLDGMTPLMYAAQNGQIECLKMLVESGAKTTVTDNHGNTTYIWAVIPRQNNPVVKETISCLVKNDPNFNMQDINLSNDFGDTPLMYAAYHGNVDSVNALVQAGANLECRNDSLCTALMYAAQNVAGNSECVELLLKSGADVNAHNADGRKPLLFACLAGNHRSVQLLLEAGASVNSCDYEGNSALSLSCMRGHTDIVELLLNSGADVKSRNIDSRTALLLACQTRNHRIAAAVLEAGADVNACVFDGKSPLCVACMGGFGRLVKLLLESGSNVNHTCRYGTTPLMQVANKGDRKLTTLLLQSGANIWSRDESGNTPLIWALTSNYQNYDCVPLLVKAGASLTLLEESEFAELPRALYESLFIHMNLSQSVLGLHCKCRNVIRSHLTETSKGGNSTNLVVMVSQLPLPPALKSYLLFEENRDSMYFESIYEHYSLFLKQKRRSGNSKICSLSDSNVLWNFFVIERNWCNYSFKWKAQCCC